MPTPKKKTATRTSAKAKLAPKTINPIVLTGDVMKDAAYLSRLLNRPVVTVTRPNVTDQIGNPPTLVPQPIKLPEHEREFLEKCALVGSYANVVLPDGLSMARAMHLFEHFLVTVPSRFDAGNMPSAVAATGITKESLNEEQPSPVNTCAEHPARSAGAGVGVAMSVFEAAVCRLRNIAERASILAERTSVALAPMIVHQPASTGGNRPESIPAESAVINSLHSIADEIEAAINCTHSTLDRGQL